MGYKKKCTKNNTAGQGQKNLWFTIKNKSAFLFEKSYWDFFFYEDKRDDNLSICCHTSSFSLIKKKHREGESAGMPRFSF